MDVGSHFRTVLICGPGVVTGWLAQLFIHLFSKRSLSTGPMCLAWY